MGTNQQAPARARRARAGRSRRFYGVLTAAGLTFLAAAPAASATKVFGGSLTSASAVKRTCTARLLPSDTRGVALRRVTAADTGLLRVRLAARRGDWDVAVFDATTKKLVAGSAGFRSRELAQSGIIDGQRLVIQACRRSGRAKRAHIEVRTIALQPDTEKIRLVRVHAGNQAERTRLASSGLDITEHGGADYLDVLAHGRKDLERIRELKFGYDIVLDDVVAADAATLQSKRYSPGDGTPLEDARGPIMPSGRVAYRRLFHYQQDLKKLVELAPDYVRPITLAHPSLEGQLIEGVEIAKDVAKDDGRPVFLQMGVHHAREWPSGEHAIEFAFDLVNNRKAEDVQFVGRKVNVADLLSRVRTIVVPIVNPDGFSLSREAAIDAQQGVFPSGTPSSNGVIPHSLAYKRKNCRVKDGLLPGPGDCGKVASNIGVDPNRNYGGFWGGAGASGVLNNETYWGAGPFSEPETQSIRELVSARQVVGLITNHTYSDLVLRPPGLRSQGEPHDEHRGYKALGDGMAEENGYVSEPSYSLYDTTGTTEDWTYTATGGFGFTFEIGKGEGVALTGAGFHPVYPVGVVAEYFGKGPYAGRGNRSAYYKALEWAAEAKNHSVIEGKAKKGWTLKLTKSFETATSRPGLAIQDKLETTLRMDKTGAFKWHVNPSTRPNVAKGIPGRAVDGRPQTAPKDFRTKGQRLLPAADADEVPGTYEEEVFSIPATEDNGEGVVRVEWPRVGGSSDMDVFVYKMVDGSWEQVGSATSSNSATAPCSLGGRTGTCDFEVAKVQDVGNGQFKLRVKNWASTSSDWVGRMTFAAPVAKEAVPPATETWTLTCISPDGEAKEEQVYVDRGGRVDVGDACKKDGNTNSRSKNG